ncbi:uncharacterized protein PFLUO_LOCUS3545 [Penicillium psychrofluorescens]|uniref:uncharacterized protein n=1 Tax=Penicillium psychrofluorescens TaxID=3158075 RepID=UPI003CCDB692
MHLTDPPETIGTVASTAPQLQDDAPSRNQEERPLYFAYGSNLSPTQMHHRCVYNPTHSAQPLAIAVLPRWRWFICQRGYANVLPPKALRVASQSAFVPLTEEPERDEEDEEVYGVLYAMHPLDEEELDMYEGVDHDAASLEGLECATETTSEEAKNGHGGYGTIRPRAQGDGCYNKWYVDAQIVRWLVPSREEEKTVRVLVYVDEQRVREGPPKTEYIGRMNRGVRESERLGLPAQWVESTMRRFIPHEA